MAITEVTTEIIPNLFPERSPSPIEACSSLEALSEKAKGEMQTLADIPFNFSKPRGLVEWYWGTKKLEAAYSEAVRSLGTKTDIRGNLSGVILQDLYYALIAKREVELESSRIIVPSTGTLELWKTLHPNAKIAESGFSITSLMGLSVPDMLSLEVSEGRITVKRLYEITLLQKSTKTKENKERHLETLRKAYPEIFGDAEIRWIIPGKEKPFIDSSKRPLFFPFTKDKFRDLIDDIYQNYRPDEGFLTLDEIEKIITQESQQTQAI